MSRDRRDVEDRVRTLLETFRMKRALDVLAAVLPADKPGRTQTLEVFERLLRTELDDRRERRIARRLEDSHLPDRPTLETFEFNFQPKLDKAHVLDLAQLAWVERKEDLVLVGDPGVGKSHIAKALCVLAAGQERRVLYTTCADMMLDLHAALADGSLRSRVKRYTSPELLLIDDLGYDPIEQEHAREAQLLHKVLDGRHGRVSTIVTSNLDVDAWAEYLGHPQLTMALLDKLLFRATAIRIDGPSYRLDQHNRRQSARKSKKAEGGAGSERASSQ
jgi:DNA replication protein DnaC